MLAYGILSARFGRLHALSVRNSFFFRAFGLYETQKIRIVLHSGKRFNSVSCHSVKLRKELILTVLPQHNGMLVHCRVIVSSSYVKLVVKTMWSRLFCVERRTCQQSWRVG